MLSYFDDSALEGVNLTTQRFYGGRYPNLAYFNAWFFWLTERMPTFKGHIETGPEDSYGRKSCDHFEFDGVVWRDDLGAFSSSVYHPPQPVWFSDFPNQFSPEWWEVTLTNKKLPGNFLHKCAQMIFPGSDYVIRNGRGATLLEAWMSELGHAGYCRVYYYEPQYTKQKFNGTFKCEVLAWQVSWESGRPRGWGKRKYATYTSGVFDSELGAQVDCYIQIQKKLDATPWSSQYYSDYFRASQTHWSTQSSLLRKIKVACAHPDEGLMRRLRRGDATRQREDAYGEATQKAADSLHYFQNNSLSLIKELFEFRSSLESVLDLLSGPASAKALSSAVLSSYYGPKLTVLDLMELDEAVLDRVAHNHHLYSRTHGSYRTWEEFEGHTWRCNYTATIYYDPYPVSRLDDEILNSFYDWGLLLSAENLWDVIPYSFVVDWYWDVQTLCHRADTIGYLRRLNTSGTVVSRKADTPLSPRDIKEMIDPALNGQVYLRHYHRTDTREHLYLPPPTFSGTDSPSHIVETTALLLQN